VLQIPVTVYQRDAYPQLLGRVAAPVSTIRKLDPDWFLDEREAVAAIDAVVAARLPYVVVFLHSFSLLSPGEASGAPAPNVRSANVLRAMLEHIRARRLPVVTMRQIAASQVASAHQDVVPTVHVTVGLHRYAWQRARQGGRSLILLQAVAATVAAAALLCVMVRRFRRLPVAVRRQAVSTAGTGPKGRS
jgi:hypothetical protein